MRTAVRNAVLLVVGAAAAIALGVYADRTAVRPGVVDVLPRNTAIIAELDVKTLRKSTWGAEALDSGPLHKAMDDVRRRCGVDPFVGVERIGIAMPGGAGLGSDVAIVATGSGIRAREVTTCAQAMVRERGGEARVSKRGSFVTVQDGTGERGILAVRDSGPIVIGGNPWLDAILDVADRVTPSMRGDPLHDHRRGAAKDAFVTLTYALPADERARLTPLLPKGAAALTEMPSLFAALRVEDRQVALDVEAVCSPPSCLALADWIKGARDILARDPRVTILGLRAQIDAATITAEDERVRVRMTLPFSEMERIGAQLSSDAPLESPTLPAGHPSGSAVGPLAAPLSTASASK